MSQSLGSLAFAAAGVGLASSATAFAIYMVSDRDRAPALSGTEHLMIFARPSSYDGSKSQARRSSETPPAALDADDMPVGSIKPHDTSSDGHSPDDRIGEGEAPGRERRTEIPARGIFNGKALIEIPIGFALVEPGSTLPGVGRVLMIEARGSKWVVVTTNHVASADR